jgi:methyl-accepting chemotaxis protein
VQSVAQVKALAEQTAKATDEIGQQVSGIEAATQDSVGAIQEISGAIEKLSEISTVIAAPVEEQGAPTQEISRNVQQAAKRHAAGLRQHQRRAALSGRNRDGLFAAAAQSLSRDSNRLKLEVGNFLESVRAA